MTIKVLSFNIRRGLGSDLKLDIFRTAKLITSFDPDVVCLQEVFDGSRLFRQSQYQRLSDYTGLESVYHESHSVLGFGWGNLVLTKHKIINQEKHQLPYSFERRICQISKLDINGKETTLMNTHLGLFRAEINKQIKQLELLIAENNIDIICGDFNSDINGVLDLPSYNYVLRGEKTYPSSKPRKSLDNIVYANKMKLINFDVVNTKVSDHLPVLAEFKVKK